LREHPTASLLVEPTALARRGVAADDDIVDFAVELNAVVVDKIQVKGSANPLSQNLHPGEANTVLARLSGSTTSTATLLTNRPLSSGLAEQWARTDDGDGITAIFAHTARNDGEGPVVRRILVDHRSIDDLADSVAEHIRELRGDRNLSQGESSAPSTNSTPNNSPTDYCHKPPRPRRTRSTVLTIPHPDTPDGNDVFG
jgi:hypothetical protein